MWVILVLVVTGENKVNSYSDQLKLGWVCKFGVEFDNILQIYQIGVFKEPIIMLVGAP